MQLLLSLLVLSAAFASQVRANTTGSPNSLHELATNFPPTAIVDPISIESIRNTLALYPFAIDGKNFDALSNVFSADAAANYSAPLNVLSPLSDIKATLSASLSCVTTQHQFGTQLIDIDGPLEARSVTYFRAAHFGTTPETEDQVLYTFGQYQDAWRRQADASWRIVRRDLVYMGPRIGNQMVFLC
ncbi:hypothetical protein PHISP_01647 [Aspergillus sp. HF37]|nr:hypothetical protein PHISP_01647 [Aspergillus sp. HF37]